MEVGAVKQAFNNELIKLKNNLNQAKIQTIHKLTRKAKTLTEKKAPENLKEKLKRKAESAVKEVLIIKKIKARDIGKFIVTHKGQLQDFLNNPQVNNDRACARLLLHKAMQAKYKLIRSRFSDIPIKDLFMSRQERLKIKKEARLDKKKKQKAKKDKVVSLEGDWDVDDVQMKEHTGDDSNDQKEDISDDDSGRKIKKSDASNEASDSEFDGEGENSELDENSELGESDLESKATIKVKEKTDFESDSDEKSDSEESDEHSQTQSDNNSENNEESDDNNGTTGQQVGNFVKVTKESSVKPRATIESKNQILNPEINTESIQKADRKKLQKKQKDTNKNKNFNDKIKQRKFKKGMDEAPIQENKVIDPFFVTATGENYMTVAEPRQPDEFKEIHRQGNRKHRRAVMFGYVPPSKPRSNNFREGYDGFSDKFIKQSDRFDENSSSKFDRNGRKKIDRNDNSRFNNYEADKRSNFKNSNENSAFRNKREDTGFKNRNGPSRNQVPKDEKLHPSWEAKKKQSGIQPFKGKKIVFNDT